MNSRTIVTVGLSVLFDVWLHFILLRTESMYLQRILMYVLLPVHVLTKDQSRSELCAKVTNARALLMIGEW